MWLAAGVGETEGVGRGSLLQETQGDEQEGMGSGTPPGTAQDYGPYQWEAQRGTVTEPERENSN